jgi:hypothetical protein
LKKEVAAGPVYKSLEHCGAVSHADKRAVGDGSVVVDEVSLGVPSFREKDLVTVGYGDLLIADSYDLSCARHL